MNQPCVIRRNVELDVSAEELWQLVSDPTRLADWMGETVDLDVRPGGTGAIRDDGVLKFVHVDHVDVGRRLSFSWWEPDQSDHTAQVVFDVVPTSEGGSRLHITETYIGTLDDDLPTSTSASASMTDDTRRQLRQQRWEARVCALWACTVVAALVA